MKRLWFRAKYYGWGWYPVTWEGWLITLSYLFLLIYLATRISKHQENMATFITVFIILTSILVFICFKTGEKPRWRWGK